MKKYNATGRASGKVSRQKLDGSWFIHYRFKCQNCSYGREYGASRIQCELDAAKHAHRYTDHLVLVEELRVIGATQRKGQADLLDEPPF